MDEVNSKVTDDIRVAKSNVKYRIVPIYSYEELHERYGGNKTGYRKRSEWCHANGSSTYESWTKNGT